MRKILLFGAGKSAGALIRYLLENAEKGKWQLQVADMQIDVAKAKLNNHPAGIAIGMDILDAAQRENYISTSDLVISLLPPHLHILVARDCVNQGKNLITASYADEAIKALHQEAVKNGIVLLCEMGLDPGIDHMSAKSILDQIRASDGKITSFISHCGGLVAPESDDNPWHYKISWNPRNVVMAGKSGAYYRQDEKLVELAYEDIFLEKRLVAVPGHDLLCWYPNRDSITYINLYGLEDTPTFIRTTLRHPDFMYGWKNIIDLKLTDEAKIYETDQKSLAAFFKEHLDRNGFSEWLELKLKEQFTSAKDLLSELVNLAGMEQKAEEKGVEALDEFMMVDEKGDLKEIDIEDLKINAATSLADNMHTASLTLKQLFFLGMNDHTTLINKGLCSAADVLQFALEKKLPLLPNDKDLVIMLHEIEYEKNGKRYKHESTLKVTGKNAVETAMAETVGLPMGIAARMILNGQLNLKGVMLPLLPEIYVPVLTELKNNDIQFTENTIEIS